MDSLLSNSQRCARKADSLVTHGLYEEALAQLDQSITYLNELKATTSRFETIQLLNEQIDSMDRKMRSVAIKRAEAIKRKNQIEALINKNKKDQQQSNRANSSSDPVNPSTNKFKHGAKLNKDDKAVLEELSTTNVEYKKVNTFLINEIEKLKKENDFLKVELLKIHMTESFSSAASISCASSETGHKEDETTSPSVITATTVTIDSTHSSPTNTASSSSNSSSSIIASSQTSHTTNSSSLNDISVEYSANNQTLVPSGGDKNSAVVGGGTVKVNRQLLQPHLEAPTSNRIDLSRYINNDDDEDDGVDDDDLFNNSNGNENLDDSDYMYNNAGQGDGRMPPSEFTID